MKLKILSAGVASLFTWAMVYVIGQEPHKEKRITDSITYRNLDFNHNIKQVSEISQAIDSVKADWEKIKTALEQKQNKKPR